MHNTKPCSERPVFNEYIIHSFILIQTHRICVWIGFGLKDRMDQNLLAIKVTVTFYLGAFKNALDNFERNQVPLRTKTRHLRNKII